MNITKELSFTIFDLKYVILKIEYHGCIENICVDTYTSEKIFYNCLWLFYNYISMMNLFVFIFGCKYVKKESTIILIYKDIILFYNDYIRNRYDENHIILNYDNDSNKLFICCPYCRTKIIDVEIETLKNQEECIICYNDKNEFIKFTSCRHKICKDCYNYKLK